MESGIGSIKIKVQSDDGKTNYVIMYDVYVLDLRNNLLSVMKLMNRGLKVNFINHTVKICQKSSDEVIVIGEQLNDHFVIDTMPITENNTNVCNNVDTSSEKSDNRIVSKFSRNIEDLWHVIYVWHINNKYAEANTRKSCYRN